jgi:hypothetical protein
VCECVCVCVCVCVCMVRSQDSTFQAYIRKLYLDYSKCSAIFQTGM